VQPDIKRSAIEQHSDRQRFSAAVLAGEHAEGVIEIAGSGIPDSDYNHSDDRLLAEHVAERGRQGQPAADLINTYATSKAHAWNLRTTYLKAMGDSDMVQPNRFGPTEIAHNRALYRQAVDLLEPGKYPPEFVLDRMADIVEITDYATGEYLTATYLARHPELPIDDEFAVRSMVDFATMVARKEGTVAPDVLDRLDDRVREAISHLTSPVDAVYLQLRWDMANGLHDRPEAIEAVVESIHQARQAAVEASHDLHSTRRYTPAGSHIYVDSEVRLAAADQAAKGRFGVAARLLSAIHFEDIRDRAAAECLNHAVTPEEVQELAHDDLVSQSTLFALQCRTATAKLSGDVAELASVTPLWQSRLDTDDYRRIMVICTQLAEICDAATAANPEVGQLLSGEVLAQLHAEHVSYLLFEQFSLAAISRGDVAEARRAYATIQTEINPAKLRHLWRIAQAIGNQEL
jgi:hypothetical protein